MSTLPELLSVLRAKAGFDPVQQAQEDNRIYLFGRIKGQDISNMLVLTSRLLLAAPTANWSVDVSQAYTIKNGKLAKGWRVIVNADDVQSALAQVVATIKSAPSARQRQVEEFPLSGCSASRSGQDARGKGASTIGQAVIGRR